jgi:acyl phosphate:glycerol-3-phosphate acyltransferase
MSSAFLSEIALTTLLLAIAFGYLCGSIPFGLILTKLFGASDLRSVGSGNIGATNVLRTGRKDLAAATLLLDALKGAFAVYVAARFGPAAAAAAGFGAFLGHIYPVWLGFRGGKGVATFLGVMIGLDWRAAAVFALVWIMIAGASRYSSMAALTASVTAPIVLLQAGRPALAALAFVLVCILFWTHRENIARLRAGTESKIGQKG